MKHVGIIGAGISGLVTAKTFSSKGYRVTIFEKGAAIGGVWEGSRSYLGVATQTTRDEYAFSDYPMPADYPLWPSGPQVQVNAGRGVTIMPKRGMEMALNNVPA